MDMLWLLLTWIALGLGVARLFGEAAATMSAERPDEDPAPGEAGCAEDLFA